MRNGTCSPRGVESCDWPGSLRGEVPVKAPVPSKTLSAAVRRRLELAIAVAEERLLATHVEHALGLIEMVGDEVPLETALEIYNRLLHLSGEEARIITTRALAHIGEHAVEAEVWPRLMARSSKSADAVAAAPASGRDGGKAAKEGTADVQPAPPVAGKGRALFSNLRQRIRGRVNDDLRQRIELAAARTEVALLRRHTDNALAFVDVLEEELSLPEAVQIYIQALDLRESIAEVVYYLTLAQIADRRLPPRRATARREPAVAGPAARPELSVVEGGKGG